MRCRKPLTFSVLISSLLILTAFFSPAVSFAQLTDSCEFYKPGFTDYCPFGVPDFDQKQSEDWRNPMTGAYSWDGPVALANCLWWFDSKFEKYPEDPRLTGFALNDFYSLIGTYDPDLLWDDHAYMNVPFFIERLGPYLKVDSVSQNFNGTVITEMESGFHRWLANETELEGAYSTRIVNGPEFEEISRSLQACQNVILLLGFYEEFAGVSCNWLGGHYVTLAGVNTVDTGFCLCDPYFDGNEWEPPIGNNGHADDLHNDASFASGPHGSVHRDCYHLRRATADLCITDARWELYDYPSDWNDIGVFAGLNPLHPDGVIPGYNGLNILVLVDAALIITPDSCAATGDVNNDGIGLQNSDAFTLADYVLTGNNEPQNLYDCDMNGDGHLDQWDVQLFNDYLEYGFGVFGPYGGYPVKNNCCVSTVRGACCLGDSCYVLAPENCTLAGGTYLGDSTFCEGNPCECCVGFTGNADCSSDEIPDISDITRLIDYLYISHDELCCPKEADVNASGDPEPDITDITRLIDYLYISQTPLPDCP